MSSVQVKVEINDATIKRKLDSLIDSRTMLQIHNLLAKMCDPYVPFDEGVLSQSVDISPESVRYTQPYARYQYYGEVYGPNIPIIENGVVVGWFSPPGQKKHPTGRPINYNTNSHPLATSKWNEAMMRDHREEFIEQVRQILRQRAREIYG